MTSKVLPNDYKLLQILFIFGNSGEVRWWVKVGWGGGCIMYIYVCTVFTVPGLPRQPIVRPVPEAGACKKIFVFNRYYLLF
jgi:hypothetical protein